MSYHNVGEFHLDPDRTLNNTLILLFWKENMPTKHGKSKEDLSKECLIVSTAEIKH